MKTFLLSILIFSFATIAQTFNKNGLNSSDSTLVAFYPFNGNANDESGNGHNGIVNGGVLTSDRFNHSSRACTFPNLHNKITLENSTSLNLNSGFTLNVWVRFKNINSGIVGKQNCWTPNGFYLGIDNSQFWFLVANSVWSEVRTNEVFIEDKWYMVTGVYDNSTSTIKIYVDGQLKGTAIGNYTNFSSAPVTISEALNGCPNGNMPDAIDEVKIYNRSLSDAEVQQGYNLSSNGLVAFYQFNANTLDSSGNFNDGINHKGVYEKDRYGFDNSSMYFNGVDSYVEGINPGNNLPIGNSPRTFSAWIKNYEFNQWGSNIFHYGTAQPAPTNFHFLVADVLGLGNGYGYGVVYGNTNLNDSIWHFVTGVYEGGTERITKLFVDGKLDSTDVLTTEPNTILGNNWKIGQFIASGTPFKGNIDELKVFNITLTEQQIWDMYKATTTAPNLIFPGNDSTLINPWPTFVLDWDSTVTATSYRLVIANDSLFTTTLHDTIINVSSFDFYNWSSVNIDNLYWKIRTINVGGTGPWSQINHFNIMLTDVEDESQLPTEFALMQNYPNPFNPSTVISYQLPVGGNVTLKVYDVLGNEIATLVNEEKPAGIYEVEFNVAHESFRASGVYFYRLQVVDPGTSSGQGFVETKKMLLIK